MDCHPEQSSYSSGGSHDPQSSEILGKAPYRRDGLGQPALAGQASLDYDGL